MGKINEIKNGQKASVARGNMNEAIKTVEVDGTTITGDGNVGNPLVAVVAGINFNDVINWNGSEYTFNMGSTDTDRLHILSGTTSITLSYSGLSSSEQTQKQAIIYNTGNTSTIEVVVFNGNWKWSVGDPINSIAAGGSVEINMKNRDGSILKAESEVDDND